VAQLNAELNKALASAAFQAFAKQSFLETMQGSPDQFARLLAQSQSDAARTFQAIGIQPTDAPADAPATSR
jgi:tripartite-type tricarboxylate transporter receptor subunit TctC